jgi:hypothetical protein
MASGLERVWIPSAIAVLLLNFTLDTSLFPQLGRLEPGAEFAAKAKQLNLDWSRTFFVGGKVTSHFSSTWATSFRWWDSNTWRRYCGAARPHSRWSTSIGISG